MARDFFEHREIAKWQARQFDKCIDNLPVNQLVVLIDYSMNYSHVHLNEAGGEHWSHVQTTVVPVVVYKRDASGQVNAHSHIYMSADLNHSNNMVQHILNDTIKRDKESNPSINIAHIWSDGCAGQLKNKHQLHWLTCKVDGVKVSHNFFQS